MYINTNSMKTCKIFIFYSKCEDLFFIIDDQAVLARRNRSHAAEVTPAGKYCT
jgi:hypothetical protein